MALSTKTIISDTVVLACGAWGNELLEPVGIDGHVSCKKRQLFSVSAKGPKDWRSYSIRRASTLWAFFPW